MSENPNRYCYNTLLVEYLINFEGGLFNVGQRTHTDVSQYNGYTYNGTLESEVVEPITLISVNVINDESGFREINLVDATDGTTLQAAFVSAAIGQTTATLNFDIMPSSYILTTNQDQNIATQGTVSPRFMPST